MEQNHGPESWLGCPHTFVSCGGGPSKATHASVSFCDVSVAVGQKKRGEVALESHRGKLEEKINGFDEEALHWGFWEEGWAWGWVCVGGCVCVCVGCGGWGGVAVNTSQPIN